MAKKSKKLSFRQRLRAEADTRLTVLQQRMESAAIEVSKDEAISPFDLMRLCCTGMTKTMRARMITQLADAKEAELEQIFNNQQDLDLEEKGDPDGD